MSKPISPSLLSFLTVVGAMACVILCVLEVHYTRQLRELRRLQQNAVVVKQRQEIMNQLAADLYAYSQTNAAIRPILNSAGIKTRQP